MARVGQMRFYDAAARTSTLDELIGEEEVPERLPQGGERIGGVDDSAQMRAVVEALGVPRAECPQFVDNPPIVSRGSRLVDAFLQEQLDVVEEKAPTILERHRAC